MRFAIFVFTTLTALAFLNSLSHGQVAPATIQVINVLNPAVDEEITLRFGVPVILRFDKMGGRRVSVSATRYPIILKASEVPFDAYLAHFFFCPMQTMANDPADPKIWLTSLDPGSRHDATHTWLQLNRSGEVTVKFEKFSAGRVRPGFNPSGPLESRDQVYLNFLIRPGGKFVTWDANMYDFENLIRDKSKENLSAMQRARPGNIGGNGCAQPQIEIRARLLP